MLMTIVVMIMVVRCHLRIEAVVTWQDDVIFVIMITIIDILIIVMMIMMII